MALSPKLRRLAEALAELPGIGPLSAQRIAFHLLSDDEHAEAHRLAKELEDAAASVRHCARCNTLCESEICDTCSDETREKDKLCIVEMPADQLVIEGSHSYRGLYYVLGGRLSPVENRGPEQLGFSRLIERIKEPEVKEVILATSFTAEGDATAHYIALAVSRHRPDIRLTRLARGIPTGIELEYTDVATVAHAILGRRDAESR